MEEITQKICEFPGVCERLLGKGMFGLKAAGGFQMRWKRGGLSGSTCKSLHAGCEPSSAARGLATAAAADQSGVPTAPAPWSLRGREPTWFGEAQS